MGHPTHDSNRSCACQAYDRPSRAIEGSHRQRNHVAELTSLRAAAEVHRENLAIEETSYARFDRAGSFPCGAFAILK